jgi:hypothetical protein
MPIMTEERNLLAFKVVLLSWVTAAAALPEALLIAVVGQGIGAVVGGGAWIGISVPLDRQVWALVNEPGAAFASQTAAVGYWLGSTVLPLIVALCAVPMFPRARSVAAELAMLHLSWACAAIGLAWLPLLDPDDGHLIRLLMLQDLPRELLWLLPGVAAASIFVPALRLLALARAARLHTGRRARLWLIMLHLWMPSLAWLGAIAWLSSAVPIASAVGLALPLISAAMVAWLGYPAPFAHQLRGVVFSTLTKPAVALVLIGCLVWLAGRPTGNGQRAGALWAVTSATNNIRPWIDCMPQSLRR